MKKLLSKLMCKIDPIFSDQYYTMELLERSDRLEEEINKLDKVSDNELYLCKVKENSYIISILKLINENDIPRGSATKYYKKNEVTWGDDRISFTKKDDVFKWS